MNRSPQLPGGEKVLLDRPQRGQREAQRWVEELEVKGSLESGATDHHPLNCGVANSITVGMARKEEGWMNVIP